MPGATSMFRVLVGSVTLLLAMSGCQALDDAGQVIGRADLVNELAARMDRAMELTYSADYQISGGQTASIAQTQEPVRRSAYSYPGGKITVTTEATTECDTTGKPPTCALSEVPKPSTRPSVTVFNEASERGLVTPPVVVNMLTTAALDPAAVIETSTTTVAGHHATCIAVKEVSSTEIAPFDTCVTADGILGSFEGVVNGKPAELALTHYRDSVDSDAFDLPTDAKIIDNR